MNASSQPDMETPQRRDLQLGCAFAVVFSVHSILGVILPRLEKESALREAGRGWHYLLGICIAVLGLWLLLRWRSRGFVLAPGSLPGGMRAWHAMISVALAATPLLAVPLGFVNAWGEGRIVHLANLVDLPTLMGQDRAVWQFAGYFHSAIGNLLVLICMLGLVSAGYGALRYGKGLMRAFPFGFGPLIVVKSTAFVYAINSFRVRERGYVAAAILLALVVVAGAVSLLLRHTRDRSWPATPRPLSALVAGAMTLVAAALLAGFAPYLMFKVSPIASGVVIHGDPSVTWHTQRVAGFTPQPETEFERGTAMKTFKWCEFCHTMRAGETTLVGPNLHFIFGQHAGTVPNFYYSPAMARAGQAGLVWNRQTVAAFIANPEQFVPGTSMHISDGPVSDPQVRAAVTEILLRRTVADSGH